MLTPIEVTMGCKTFNYFLHIVILNALSVVENLTRRKEHLFSALAKAILIISP